MTSAREEGSTKKGWVAYGNEKDAAAVGNLRGHVRKWSSGVRGTMSAAAGELGECV